jgi:hypothetical protein
MIQGHRRGSCLRSRCRFTCGRHAIVSFGTAVTVDLVDETGTDQRGQLPGVRLRFSRCTNMPPRA